MDKKLELKHIPYNPKLKLKASELRKSETESEKIFWKEIIKNKEINNYNFLRQKPIDNFIADFYCSKLLLIVEIDGDVHIDLKIRDSERTNILEEKYNLKVVRFKNNDIVNNINKVKEEFIKILNKRERDL